MVETSTSVVPDEIAQFASHAGDVRDRPIPNRIRRVVEKPRHRKLDRARRSERSRRDGDVGGRFSHGRETINSLYGNDFIAL